MKNTFKNTPLDEKVFADEIDFKTLEHILSCLNHITPKKVSRTEFEGLNGDFLKTTGEDKALVFYDLFLPEDMMKGEYLSIIHFLDKEFDLNKFNVGDDIITSTKVMVKLILKSNSPDDLENLAVKYGISEDLKQELQPQNKGGKKINFSQVKRLIKELKEKRTKYEVKDEEEISKLKENIGENPDDLNNYSIDFSKELEQEFDLTFFRKGKNMLRYGMMTIVQEEQKAIIKYCEDNGFKKIIYEDGDILYKKGKEIIGINVSIQELDEKERLLREKIGIDELSEDLKEAKKSGDQELINSLELKAANKIAKILYEYPYQLTQEHFGYQPSGIIKSKELYCVGYSIVGHTFLEELGIKYNGLDISAHSALEIIIGGEKYYFDATYKNNIVKFSYGETIGNYREIVLDKGSFKEKKFAQSGNVEKILLFNILVNKGIRLNNEEKLKMFEKAIELNPTSATIYIHKGDALYELERYDEAIKMFEKAIELNPELATTIYTYIGHALFKLDRYDDAIKIYEKAIELNPNNFSAYNNKGIILLIKGKYEEAIIMYDKAIELKPNNSVCYSKKGNAFKKLKQNKLSNLYHYASTLLNGKKVLLSVLYRKEKAIIKQLIQNSDFEGLRVYLLELE